MRSSFPMRQQTLRGISTLLPVIVITVLMLITSYIATTRARSSTGKSHDAYISPTARVVLKSYNYPINENPETSKKVIIYRAIGNSLPPRHAANQTYQNLLFTLLYEPELPHAEKRWYINRLLDTGEEARIIKLLITHGQTFFVDSLDWQRYRTLKPIIDHANRIWSTRYVRRFPKRVMQAWIRVLNGKTLYVMHCNGARNRMLELGFSAGAEFVLPGDGNIFFTRAAWAEIMSGIGNTGYYAIPMLRVARNSDLRRVERKGATEEPQILFRVGSRARFDETLAYGEAPKLELLNRLSGMGLLESVGWCVRLADGSGEVMNARDREMKRYEGVEKALAWADWQAFNIQGSGHGFDIGMCVVKLCGLHLDEGLFQHMCSKRFSDMQEREVCQWIEAAIQDIPLDESRTMTEMEKVRMVTLLDMIGTYSLTGCTHETMMLVSEWCRRYVGMVEEWEAGWWVREHGVDGLLAAVSGALLRDYRFATRVGIGARVGREVVDVAEWVRCVERRVGWRVGVASVGLKSL